MYSLEEATIYWAEAGGHGTPEERKARAMRWLPYYSDMVEKCIGKPFVTPPGVKRTVDFILSQNIISGSDTLIDIGAGTGSYALEFAKHCAEVAAMDVNTASLNVISDRADRSGLSNISVIPSAWEDYEPNRQYDIVFSSMCPAICDIEELKKAERLARKSVCILTVTRGSYNKCRMELMEHFGVKGKGGMVTEALHYYNTLYLMGRQPNVKCWTDRGTSVASAESMIERYKKYFALFDIDESVSVPYMEEFFAARAHNGMVEDETLMNHALVYWDVPNK